MRKGDKAKNVLGLVVVFLIVIVSLFVGVVSAAEAETIIIDTEKGVPGFWTEPARDLPGNWWYVQDHLDSSADGWFVTNAYPPGQGNGSFWYTISFPDMDECKGIWMASLSHSGNYEVFAWIPDPDPFDPYLDESTPPSDYLPTKKAQYKIFHNGGVATVTIDQNVNKGGFTSLGVFEFDSTARVELSSNGVEFWRCVAFDAVKFVPIQTPIDTTAPGNNQTGKGTEDTVPQLAPLNPDFVAYKENPPETFYGYIPPPIDLSHLDQIPVVGLPTLDKLPSSFDWRDQGKVTSVKNQNPCGTCWTFGTTSVLESAVLIGESVVSDFSEQSVALCVDRSWYYLYDGPTDPCNGGGWSWMASEVFIKKGSVQESCNPYDTSALNCDGSCVCDDCPPIKKVDGYRLATNDGSQLDVIKNAVYNHEPVTVAYRHSGSYEYWDPTWGAIYDYYPSSGYANHIISIIGWDDDVPHPNPGHTGTGAWIVKNSWGTADSWAGGAGVSDGYFYLAYDSSCANEIAYLEYKNPVSGEELLYWDEAGYVSSVGYKDNSAWMANVFTAPESRDLTHVDFWTTSNNAQYELYVWNGFFGSELAYQTGTCQEFGYYSILLNEPISIDASQQFTVGVKMTTPGYGYPIPVECEIPGDVDPPIQTDVSFIRHTDSGSWTDLADSDRNACLRARLLMSPSDNYGVFKDGLWFVDTNGDHVADLIFMYGFAGAIPLVGNFGSDDIAIVGAYGGNYRWFVDTTGDHVADEEFWFGFEGAIPLVGDIDQDGTDDIAIVGAYGGNYRWFVDTNGDHVADEEFWFGFEGAIPLVGDIDRDGTDDIAIVGAYGGNYRWFVDTNGDHVADEEFWFGFAGAIPLVGDIDRDRTDDIAIVGAYGGNYRWFVDTNFDKTADQEFWFGFAGATPLVGDIG